MGRVSDALQLIADGEEKVSRHIVDKLLADRVSNGWHEDWLYSGDREMAKQAAIEILTEVIGDL